MRRSFKRSNVVPQWAREITDAEAGSDVKIIWYSYKNGYRGHGKGSPWDKRITCHADNDRTRASVCLVLHEITHVITPIDTVRNRERWAWHGPEFIKRVIKLYEKYGVLEYASEWEHYKRIRSAIKRYLLMNKYKNAGGDSNTYVQVKCPVCGYKDITQDKANWTCSECADKKEMKSRVASGIKTAIADKRTSLELKTALNTLLPKFEEKLVPVKEDDFMQALRKVTGIKEPEPAKVIKEYTVNGLQCKIVSTKRN